MTNAVASAMNVFVSVPGALLALFPLSAAPIADAITLIQEMLTSVTHVVVSVVPTLAQLPSDLLTLLSGPTVTATSTVSGGVKPDATEPLLGARASERDQAAPTFLAGGMALPADIAPLENLGDIATTGLRNELPVSGIASPAHNAIVQSGLVSFLEHSYPRIVCTCFIVGVGRSGSARCRRAANRLRIRGAGRIPPGEGALRGATSGNRVLRGPRTVGCCPFGFADCPASACVGGQSRPRIAHRPSKHFTGGLSAGRRRLAIS